MLGLLLEIDFLLKFSSLFYGDYRGGEMEWGWRGFFSCIIGSSQLLKLSDALVIGFYIHLCNGASIFCLKCCPTIVREIWVNVSIYLDVVELWSRYDNWLKLTEGKFLYIKYFYYSEILWWYNACWKSHIDYN